MATQNTQTHMVSKMDGCLLLSWVEKHPCDFPKLAEMLVQCIVIVELGGDILAHNRHFGFHVIGWDTATSAQWGPSGWKNNTCLWFPLIMEYKIPYIFNV